MLETDDSGNVTAVNVFADDGLVARAVSGTWKYYQFDPQGSVSQRSTASGTVSSSSLYEAYGKAVTYPGTSSDVFQWNGRWGYYYDGSTGLHLAQHRFYDASQGRWVNRDPIGYAGGMGLYGYCGAGPVGRRDANGHQFEEEELQLQLQAEEQAQLEMQAAIDSDTIQIMDSFENCFKMIHDIGPAGSTASASEIQAAEVELGGTSPEDLESEFLANEKQIDDEFDRTMEALTGCIRKARTPVWGPLG